MVKQKLSALGLAKLAQMVKNMPGHDAKKMMANLAASTPDVAAGIQGFLFTFDMLKRMDNRSLQTITHKADRKTLAMSLKGESEEFRLRIYECMSNRAADLLRDEIEDMGLQPASKVGEAQKAIAALAQELVARGDATLPGEGR